MEIKITMKCTTHLLEWLLSKRLEIITLVSVGKDVGRRKSSCIISGVNWCSHYGKKKAEAPILWSPDAKVRLIRKDSDAGKDWKQKEKGAAEDEMVRQHHWLNGHELEQTLGDSGGHRSLVCCSPWGRKESAWLSNWTTTTRTETQVARLQGPHSRNRTPEFLPGESHGQRSLAGYRPWGRKEPDTTEHAHTCGHSDLWTISNIFKCTLGPYETIFGFCFKGSL